MATVAYRSHIRTSDVPGATATMSSINLDVVAEVYISPSQGLSIAKSVDTSFGHTAFQVIDGQVTPTRGDLSAWRLIQQTHTIRRDIMNERGGYVNKAGIPMQLLPDLPRQLAIRGPEEREIPAALNVKPIACIMERRYRTIGGFSTNSRLRLRLSLVSLMPVIEIEFREAHGQPAAQFLVCNSDDGMTLIRHIPKSAEDTEARKHVQRLIQDASIPETYQLLGIKATRRGKTTPLMYTKTKADTPATQYLKSSGDFTVWISLRLAHDPLMEYFRMLSSQARRSTRTRQGTNEWALFRGSSHSNAWQDRHLTGAQSNLHAGLLSTNLLSRDVI